MRQAMRLQPCCRQVGSSLASLPAQISYVSNLFILPAWPVREAYEGFWLLRIVWDDLV